MYVFVQWICTTIASIKFVLFASFKELEMHNSETVYNNEYVKTR